jgi:acetate kinase
MSREESILAINGGSSSIKFALYSMGNPLELRIFGTLDRIGMEGTHLSFGDASQKQTGNLKITAKDHRSAANFMLDWLKKEVDFGSVLAVGHRIVNGGPHYSQPQQVNGKLLDELRRISPYDPEHLPSELEVLALFSEQFPSLPQVVCFDTAFHRDMPRLARILPIPRSFDAKGIRRYGFHGLSYEFLMEELTRVAGQDAAQGRVILAHLGNGASLAAVKGGKSMDTSMAFTPAAGLPMSTRSGDLDPGLVWYLARTEKMTAKQFQQMINYESGLLGVSETSSDMRDLLRREASDIRAAEAINLFCYQTKKWIGAFSAVLGGLNTLVFAGGMGENASEVRRRICSGLEFLGLELDEGRNAANGPVISSDSSQATVRVIHTDEELMIARATYRIVSKTDQIEE